MSLLIDGIVFSLQRQGGISVYFQQLLKVLVEKHTPATIVLDVPLKQDIDSCLPVKMVAQQARPFERYRFCRIPGAVSVFHSSYYRRPNIKNISTIVTVHDFVYERYARGPKRWLHTRQKFAAIRDAQAVICISESTREDMLEFVGEIPGQTVHVIHNGVSDAFRPLSLPPAEASYVLYIGERGGYKNFATLLAAMEFLPDLELHCVGGGGFRPRELAGEPESVRRRVRHLGFVTDEALNEHYNRALCLVYPSSYEGFGIPVVEAMRAGCPAVTTRCKAVMEVGGDALTVADEADPRALADAVLRLTATEYRDRMVSAGLELSRRFSWDWTHKGTLAVYESLGAKLEPAY